MYLLLSATFLSCQSAKKVAHEKKNNVLFIIVDDLRPELSVYGSILIKSPNIDALAQTGVTFNKAYCNVPVCGASRASMLTGVRPTANRYLDFRVSINQEKPSYATTLPKLFKANGYTTISNNKISHRRNDMEASWDEEWYPYEDSENWRNYLDKESILQETNGNPGPPYEAPDVKDDAYYDGITAKKTLTDLKKLKKSNKPFFLAVGFIRPHLPFNAPKKYWDIYKESDIQLPKDIPFPETAPKIANHNWGELRYYNSIPKKGPVPDKIAKKLIHGYYASVSYVDSLIGSILKELERLNLRDNTTVVLLGDHGWSLGEHNLWAKHSNFHLALRVPLIISSKGVPKGAKTNSVAELLDLFPTLCDLSGIEKPEYLDGTSLVESLKNPSKVYKKNAWVRWLEGETIIADNYFYTEWRKNNTIFSRMLYDHINDPNETINLATDPNYKIKVDSLSAMLDNYLKNYNKSEQNDILNHNKSK